MDPQTILLYDGSFDGFLCAVFTVYEEKIRLPIIYKETENNNQLFSVTEKIIPDSLKAQRVWKRFSDKTTRSQQKDFFKAFLSEIKGVENTLLSYMQNIFDHPSKKDIDYSNKDILKISQVAKMVGREKHRMEAFVRFHLIKENIYVATVSPDFNVLPLILHHFKDRYADQKWVIYDTKRNYGIYYDLNTVEIITLEKLKTVNSLLYSPQESDYQTLWNTYYSSVNIKSRKNTKLHLQHLPKRYWKYLVEKRSI
ncbi:TIGR03915 family putative DNA repair protein [Aquimarina sp. 2201CG5-10]|uniref:TIGR03915 family putative DNA repair protein n=1 Tax=Aquimarina callyspongiae TaxID=3098150 RepID=UPI002AB3FFB2|nr:TIGR03915 family putative DNA repair protein [Aquimarina sp. 2201CG5-10]MDY8136593.1 TIGR03915 family putative DNA repair protein [Aquimarina sp. 2201CG5-10]